MPILSEDIKILKSAVMADVPEGGGGMTGTPVVDGLSNEVFPDVSDSDRGLGAFNLRKLFGVAHTDDTDLLLGAGWAVLKPPTDANIDVTLFETPGWFDTRTAARLLVESQLVKGPRYLCRVQDTHYAGTSVLQLYNTAPATSFPADGESFFMRNPNGTEQRVRALKVTIIRDVVVYDSSGAFTVNLATVELSRSLTFDLLGAQVQRAAPNTNNVATLFSAVVADGARFHGVKPLASPIVLGPSAIRTVNVSGGIFSQLVPATSTPTPIVDLFPLVQRPGLARTALVPITLPATSLSLQASTVLSLPTAAEPGSLTMVHGTTNFTVDGQGQLLQGSLVVGAVDWINRTISMLGSVPNYGTASNIITYKPATVTGSTTHSISFEVTDANRSTALVQALQPPPAPGTLSLSYMAQGSWYELVENGSGKLAGADSSYGAGTVSFATGSVAASLGALPDINSTVILQWGEADSARSAAAVTSTPTATRAFATIGLPERHVPGTLALAWSRADTNYTATVSATGVVTGPAQVGVVQFLEGGGESFAFSPDTLPDGDVTITYQSLASVSGFTGGAGGNYTLTGAPIAPGSLRFTVVGTDPTASGGAVAKPFQAYSVGTNIYIGSTLIGTVNNSTGAISLNGAATLQEFRWVSVRVGRAQTGVFTGASYFTTERYQKFEEFLTYGLAVAGVLEFAYQPASGGGAASGVVSPSWVLDTKAPQGLEFVANGTVFTWAGVVHTVRNGVVYAGWNASTGASAAVGAATSGGIITLGALAPGGSNVVVWSNAALDARGSKDVLGGVFRVASAPIQAGQFQIRVGSFVGTANSGGIISGDFVGRVDSVRGVVAWTVPGLGPSEGDGTPVRADDVTYNAVFLRYTPLDPVLLGVDTSGVPTDGKVPIYRAGGAVFVHHTATFDFPNPLTKGSVYNLGRQRVASVVVRDAVGTRVPASKYEVNNSAGTVSVLLGADISMFAEPFTAEHRVQDLLQVVKADISGRIDLAGALSHNFPVGSYVSSALLQGNRFGRVFGYADRITWQGTWAATLAGADTVANFNSTDFPITTTNRGAITERWAAIFTSNTQVRVVGEFVGQILTAVPIAATIAPLNPQTLVPYFSIPAAGWGEGWAVGAVLLFQTQAAGGPAWVARSVLPGATEVLDDSATLAYIANVNTP